MNNYLLKRVNSMALIKACIEDKKEEVQTLLKKGADINFNYDKPLRIISSKGNIEILNILLENGANIFESDPSDDEYAGNSIFRSYVNGHKEIAKALINHCKNNFHEMKVDFWGGFEDTIFSFFNYVKKDEETDSDKEELKRLIPSADIHEEDDLALRNASEKGDTTTVEVLLKHGANIHAKNDEPLRFASYEGHVEVVKILLEHGANVHARDGESLSNASSKGHLEIVKILLEHGANVHAKNNKAIRLAESNGHNNIVKILKESVKSQ